MSTQSPKAKGSLMSLRCLTPAMAPAWRTKPSWAVFGTGDLPVGPALHRFQYGRAGSAVTEVEGASHFLMLSQPEIVADVIREAVTALTASEVA